MKPSNNIRGRFLMVAVFSLMVNFLQAQNNFDKIKHIKAGVLDIGYAETGAHGGQPVILLHGWPYDIYSYKDVSALLAAKGYHVYVPYLRGYGTTRFLDAATLRNGQQAALA